MDHRALGAAKRLLVRYFEPFLVIVLLASLLLIHWVVEYKVAFLSFYYVPVILAGFFVGQRTALWSAVLVSGLVVFFQLVRGLEGAPGLDPEILFTLVPWAGFLILTGYVVGLLAEQRSKHLKDLRDAYLAMLGLLTYQLEAAEPVVRGHSYRVSTLAGRLAQALGLDESEQADVRVAALLHEVGPENPRLLQLLTSFPGRVRELPIAGSLKGATKIVREYANYYEVVREDWPVDRLGVSKGAKILAVADAYETLQIESPQRPRLSPWAALAEVEKGAGRIFASDVVEALQGLISPVDGVRDLGFGELGR